MDDFGDLSDVVTSAIPQAKKPAVAPAGSFKIPADVQASRDQERLGILNQELAKTTSPEDQAALRREIARTNGGAAPKQSQASTGQFGDLADIVSSAVTTPAQSAAPSALPTSARLATAATQVEKPGMLESIGAGAGKAVGTGALAVQQLIGKGLEFAGDTAHTKTTRELIVPLKKGWDDNKNWAQNIGAWLQSDASEGVKKLAAENAPYDTAHPTANEAGQVTGAVLSPVNKLVPFSAGGSLTGTIVKGGLSGGALNALTTPVDEGKDFLTEKVKQLGAGGVAGAAGSAFGAGLSTALNKGVSALKTGVSKLSSGNPAKAAEELVGQTLSAQGLDPAKLPEGFTASLKQQVADAIKTTGKVDADALTRLTRAQTLPVPVPMTQGQITRDAMQFAKEQNLRGIQGVGEPITQTLQAQNKALVQNLDAMGAAGGSDVVTAGKSAIDTLQAADAHLQKSVGAAYDAFKAHTGKDLDVPLKGIAQDYARILDERGPNIPAAVQKKFESLGLMFGTQTKTFSINDAENLIKNYINKNYDPANKPVAGALDELRKSVEKAITEGAGSGQAGEAGKLALQARQAAKARFDLIDKTPGLKDAIAGVEPDKFIQKNILQGNIGQIKSMVDVLSKESPDALASLQSSLMAHIRGAVTNQSGAGNEIFSQAKLKNFVNNPNVSQRLQAVLGPEKMAQLKQLHQVAEDALYAPKAAAVNTSNTASAGANLVKEAVQGGGLNKIYDIAKAFPLLSTPASTLQQGNQANRAAGLINEAVNPSLSKRGAGTNVFELSKVGTKAAVAEQQQKRAQQ